MGQWRLNLTVAANAKSDITKHSTTILSRAASKKEVIFLFLVCL